jgi:hypothetical protein
MNLIKIPFFVTNFIFGLAAIALLAGGIFERSNESITSTVLRVSKLREIMKNTSNVTLVYEDPFHQNIIDPISYLMMTVGALIFILSFIGCCGSLKDSRCLIAIYAILLTTIFVLEIISISLYFYYKPELKSFMSEGIRKHYKIHDPLPSDPDSTFTYMMDFVMIDRDCCGISGDTDFYPLYSDEATQEKLRTDIFAKEAKILESDPQQIPEACCVFNDTKNKEMAKELVQKIYSDPEYENTTRTTIRELAMDPSCVSIPSVETAHIGEDKGCFDKIHTEYMSQLVIALVIIGMLQLCGTVFSVFVFRAAWYDYVS